MANAFSVQADFGDYIQPINTDLVNFVLSSKQQKYDYNVAKIDETIAEFGIDLERQEDKDYVIGKLNNVLDSVNNMGKMDLSNGNLTRDIQQQIRGTLDDKIVGAAISTKNYRNFQGTLAKAQEDGTYSDINAGHAMDRGGVSSWLQGGQDTLKSVSYVPYQDVNGKVTKNIKDLKEFNPERTIEIPFQDESGVNRIVSKKVKDLNEAEIRSYVMSNLDQNSQKQLEINGWAKFNGSTDEELTNYANAYKEGRALQYDTNIALTKKQLESAPVYMQEELRNRLDVLTSEKNTFKATMDNIGTNRDAMGRVLMQEQLVDQVTGAYADTSVSYEMKNDTAYYEKAKLDFQKVKHLAEMGAKSAATTDAGMLADPQIRKAVSTFEHPDKVNLEQETKDFVKQKEMETNIIAKQVVDGLDETTKQTFTELRKANPGKSDAEILDMIPGKPTYIDENGNEVFFKEKMTELRDVYEDATTSYTQTMKDSFDENIEKVYEEITGDGWANVNKFPLILDDGSVGTMDEYLEGEGITLEQFKANEGGIQDKVKKSIYLNKAISEAQKNLVADASVSGGFSGMNAASLGGGFSLNSEDFDRVNNYLKVNDSDDNILNYFDFKDNKTGEILKKDEVEKLIDSKSFTMKPKNSTVAALYQAAGKGAFADTRVADEGGLNDVISFDTADFQEKLKKNFNARSANDLIIDPNLGKGGKELSNVHLRLQNLANTNGMAEVNDKKPIVISRSNDPNQVLLSQVDSKATPVMALKSEVEKSLGYPLPEVKGRRITVNKEVANPNVYALDTNKAAHIEERQVLQGMMQRGEIIPTPVTREEILKSVESTSGYKDAEGENTAAGNLSQALVSNDFNNLAVIYTPKGNGGMVTIKTKDKNATEIKSFQVAPSDVQMHRATVRNTPQLYLTTMLQNMVSSYRDLGATSDLYKKLAASQNGGN